MADRRMNTGIHNVVLFDKTEGLSDSSDPVRVGENALITAENVVIDLSGSAARRKGMTLVHSGNWHSLFSCGSYGLGVVDGVLNLIESDRSLTALKAIGVNRVSYVKSFDGLHEVVYFVSVSTVGKVVNKVYADWAMGDYVGVSSTDSRVIDYLLGPPPGQLLEIFNGRMFIATGNVLRFSEIFDFARFASESLFLFDSNITMLVAVPAGLFVGTDSNVYFLKGNDALDLGINLAYRAGAIFGSSIKVSAAEIAMQSTTDIVVFGISGEGICLGDGSGNVLNMTNIPVVFPVGKTGACCVTSEKQYIISLGG